MMKSCNKLDHTIIIFVIVVLLLSAFPFGAAATTDIKDRAGIHVGAPSVWSLGQAHYPLGKMNQDNRKLETVITKSDALDPNAINITKPQIIKELLSIEAQIDQKIGVENRGELNEYKRNLLRRDRAETEFQDKKDELDRPVIDLRQMKKEQD
jgi:hypothetical protein